MECVKNSQAETVMLSIDEWCKLLASGNVSHVRPRKLSGLLTLNAYDTSRSPPLLGGIQHTDEAYAAVTAAGIPVAEMF